MTIGSSDYHRYESKLNVVENAALLLCWKDGEGFDPKQMRAFLSTDVSLSNEEILSFYSKRWAIETYFRTAKVRLAMDQKKHDMIEYIYNQTQGGATLDQIKTQLKVA
ncbi:hypothetical protein [Paenibacillus sp. FSL H7-689]|uniref:hypothetical protein n=1 Tax=Paenibacillus sp. FSL H7-689 TaxID=1227349 RepID=UPI0012DD3654|nr:hypothetical protein [Paenibacillus sp. FSL H7-689]